MSKKPAPESAPSPEAKPAKGGMIALAILGAAALATSFGVAFVFSPATDEMKVACVPGELAETPALTSGEPAAYVALDEILITVGSAPATRYIKMNLTIITAPGKVKSVEESEAVLKDAFNNYLRSVEVTDFEDPGFYIHMREQLARRAELVLGGSVARGVLITEFLLR